MKILICGFMGSGKTFWLKELEKKSVNNDYLFSDLDQVLATSLKINEKDLGDWIIKNGWPLFRSLEEEKLADFLAQNEKGIMSLGGGALTSNLIKTIKENEKIKIVFLNTPFEVCYLRIANDKNRPLSSKTKEELKKLYDERLPLYLKANLTIDESMRKEIDDAQALVHTLFSKIN